MAEARRSLQSLQRQDESCIARLRLPHVSKIEGVGSVFGSVDTLSVEAFTSHQHGMIYGQACKPDRLFENAWPVKTSIRNLYLSGSDVGVPGVNGALLAGVFDKRKNLGNNRVSRIFSAIDKAAIT